MARAPPSLSRTSAAGAVAFMECAVDASLAQQEAPITAQANGGELVGKRDRQLVVVQPLGRGLDPGLEAVTLPTHALHQHDAGGLPEQGAQYLFPRFEILPRMGRPPVEICLGTMPSQAPKSRPFANMSSLPMVATVALEMVGPIPGTVISRSQPLSLRASVSISAETSSTR
jgi:hypothetical protein